MIRLLTENLTWKLLSLALAVLLWFAFVGDPELATSISVPIQYRNIPKDLEMSSDVLERVYLEIHGPSGKLSQAGLSDTAVVLDLGTVQRSGERSFTIQQSNVTLPAGVALSRAVPAQVRLRFERRLTREVPVLLRISSPPPPGYQVTRQEIQPAVVRILGPESRVQRIDSVQTDPLDLSSAVGAMELRAQTYVADPQVRFQSSPTVTVRLEVSKTSPIEK